jgi:hypothetical protein
MDISESSRRHLRQQFHNLAAHLLQISVYCFQRARRSVSVEVPVEWDFITHLRLVVINPSVGNVRQHFPREVGFNVLFERDILSVLQVSIRFGIALSIAANVGAFVSFAQQLPNSFQLRGRQAQGLGCDGLLYIFQKGFAVQVDALSIKRRQRSFELRQHIALFGKRRHGVEFSYAFEAGLEIEPQRLLYGDCRIAKVFVVEDAAVFVGREVSIECDNARNVGVGKFLALAAQRFAHLLIKLRRIDQLNFSFALWGFVIGQNPNVVEMPVL